MVLPSGRSTSGILLPKTKADLAVFLLIACTAGFTEEIACRGYLQRQFHALTGSPWMALIIQAAVFSLAHGYDQSMVSLLAKFIGGFSFGVVAVMRRSLLPGILGHACQDCLAGALAVLVFAGK